MRDGTSSFQAPGQLCPAYHISLLFLASAGAQPQKEVFSRWPAQEAVSSGCLATSRPQHPGASAETSHFCSSSGSERPAFQLRRPPLAQNPPSRFSVAPGCLWTAGSPMEAWGRDRSCGWSSPVCAPTPLSRPSAVEFNPFLPAVPGRKFLTPGRSVYIRGPRFTPWVCSLVLGSKESIDLCLYAPLTR